MGTKGDWKRPTDSRFTKEAEENKKRLEKGKCRLNHMHDEECQGGKDAIHRPKK